MSAAPGQQKVPRTASPQGAGEKRKLCLLPANLQGIGRREGQEDAFAFVNALDREAIEKQGLLAVVADGMGGMLGGRTASQTVTASLAGSFRRFDADADPAEALEQAVRDANAAVFQALRGRGGSTVAAALIRDGKLYFVSVGDSYLFLLHNRVLIRLNRSQNVLSCELLNSMLTGRPGLREAWENPERDAITQFVGVGELEETDALRRPLALSAGDVLLLCSDGVGAVLAPDTIEKCLSHGAPEDMCAALEREIRKRDLKYQDNYTALVIQCREE